MTHRDEPPTVLLAEDHAQTAKRLSDSSAQARIRLDWNTAGPTWVLNDRLSGRTYARVGDDLVSSGLFVDLGPWGSHLFECQRGKVS